MFNYFTHSIVLIFLGYASVYPLFFWITPLQKIDQGFYRFNLGKCCIIGSLGTLAYYFIATDYFSEIILLVWLFLLGSITAFYWNRKIIHNSIITLISFLGIIALLNILSHFMDHLYFQASFAVIIGSLTGN